MITGGVAEMLVLAVPPDDGKYSTCAGFETETTHCYIHHAEKLERFMQDYMINPTKPLSK